MSVPGRRLHEIFEARVREDRQRIAVTGPDRHVTYGELDASADRLADRLRRLGVGPDVLVGLCVDRSVEMITGILGILKAGGAYVPIDPEYPAKRIRFLLEDTAVAIVVAVRRVARSLDGWPAEVVWIDDGEPRPEPVAAMPTAVEVCDRNLAYVIYTSGSSGAPKGVMIEHRNVVRLFEQTDRWFGFGERDVWTLFHSMSFDFSVWEIWGALLYGGRLVIVPAEVCRSPQLFRELLREQQVTVLNQTPSAFRHLLADYRGQKRDWDLDLRQIVFGGEQLDVGVLEPWIGRFGDRLPALVNMYGITETTVHVTYRRILSRDLAHPETSPIGIPIPDLEILLLDESGQPVPDGAVGGIYVAGPGLARGYLNRPELTAQRFVRRASAARPEGIRLYDSGDRAVRLADGQLAYAGRSDSQIKIRGFRVEPGEIELCLSRHPRVATAVVTMRDYGAGDVRLVACVEPSAGLASPDAFARLTGELVDRSREELPPHLRPSAYYVVPKIPLTPNGKLDRAALEGLAEYRLESAGTAPEARDSMTATEKVIVEISEEILKRRGLGTEDDLFDLGVTSLAFTRILATVNSRLGVSLNGSELDDEATIAALAKCVEAELKATRVTVSS
jgi:amino acid adenylation domain-containing protein